VMDASRRTTAANAYVAGLGPTKRIVLHDTLVERFDPAEVRLVVAHELGHVANRDLLRGLVFLALVAPAGMFAVAAITRWIAPPGRPPDATWIPALALALAVVVPVVTTISHGLSRRVEAAADAYALRLTGEPQAFVAFQRRVVEVNVADPDPPRWRVVLTATHPPAVERIGAALALSERPAP
jgi:STE24 endopeptidase